MRLVVLPLLTACFGVMEVSGIFYDTQTMSNPGYCDTLWIPWRCYHRRHKGIRLLPKHAPFYPLSALSGFSARYFEGLDGRYDL